MTTETITWNEIPSTSTRAIVRYFVEELGYNEVRFDPETDTLQVVGYSTDMAFQPDPDLPYNLVAKVDPYEQTIDISSPAHGRVWDTLTYDEFFEKAGQPLS